MMWNSQRYPARVLVWHLGGQLIFWPLLHIFRGGARPPTPRIYAPEYAWWEAQPDNDHNDDVVVVDDDDDDDDDDEAIRSISGYTATLLAEFLDYLYSPKYMVDNKK